MPLFRILGLMLAAPLGLSAVGCSTEPAPPQAKAVADREPAGNVKAHEYEHETADIDFGYGWPAEVAAIPALADILTEESRAAERSNTAGAREMRAESKSGGFPFHQHIFSKHWMVAANTPRLLSLTAEIATYTGGAHGNLGYDTMIWDKANASPIEIGTLFPDSAAFMAATRERFCAALNTERGDRRGEQVDPASEDPFDTCPQYTELAVAPFSSDGQAIDRITFLAEPYVAGPYAEGPYEISVPVTAETLAAVAPPYRAAFAVRE